MAKLSGSIDVPLPPDQAWECASDLARYDEWVTIHRLWRSPLPQVIEKGTEVESVVEVMGIYSRIKWVVVHCKPPEAMTLNGHGRGGVKIKLISHIVATEQGSKVTFDVHLGGPALLGPIGFLIAAALKGDINESLRRFVEVFVTPRHHE